MEAEISREGRYFLTTNLAEMSPDDIVESYKEISDIEFGLRELKDVLETRPVYQR